MLSILDLLEREIGEPVSAQAPLTPTTIGTTSTRLVIQNPQRVAFLVVNLSANTIYVAPTGVVSATTGIRLGPTGGQVAVLWKEDLVLPALEWSIIADGAASAYLLIELLLM